VYNGFNTLPILISADGTGSVGGIDPAAFVWWKNQFDATGYQADGSDIEAVFTIVHDAASKGSGSQLAPSMLVSGSATHSLFESQLQSQQRYVDAKDAIAGFRTIAFKNARYVFSPYGTTKVFMANPQSLQLVASKEMFRDKGETQELQDKQAYNFKLYSALNLVTNNRSRLAVCDQAA
jgi:hypothetical protein